MNGLANDMSYYRRRPPTEKPDESFGEFVIIVLKDEYQPDLYRTKYFLHQIWGSVDLEAWSYAYIPWAEKEEQK